MTMGVYTMEMPTFNTLATSCCSEESTKIYGYERIWSILTNTRASRRRIIEKTKMGIYNYERNNRSYNILYYAHHIW